MSRTVFSIILAAVLLALPGNAAAISFEQALASPDPTAKYFIYLHGEIIEAQGKNAVSPRYGAYHYDDIINYFADRGLVVVEEVRGKVNEHRYAVRVTEEVRGLMANGVPPENITVAGFSKGGLIALLVASSLNQPRVHFVILAGCARGLRPSAYTQFLKVKRGARLQGKLLSIYATSDLEAGSCAEAKAQHTGPGLAFSELPLRSKLGHGLFYRALPQWAQPVAAFALIGN
ncbi:hypothetical protein [Pseudodesulfovibrio sp.]|uniref:hypothetical protein n=1 Tax=unclassified Pseudodesulfovibrio TaxID=2661612 RepID=UPI003B00F1CB